FPGRGGEKTISQRPLNQNNLHSALVPPQSPDPWGTSPVGSPRRKAAGSPHRYGDSRSAQNRSEIVVPIQLFR
ncbi:MAG: hypothetical protein PVF22_06445, partial [Candidatus Aminicenantes bacterium]